MHPRKFLSLVAALMLVSWIGASAQELSLEGSWKFNTGDDTAWAKKEFDDSSWGSINVPGEWEKQGHPDYDGTAWYRRAFQVPKEMLGKDLILAIGAIDDDGTVFVNGVQAPPVKHVKANLPYLVKSPTVNENSVMAIKVFDAGEEGGILSGPVALRPAKFEELLPSEAGYTAPASGDMAAITLKMTNISSKPMQAMKLSYTVLDYDGKQVSSGNEAVTVQPDADFSKELKVAQGENKFFKVAVTVTNAAAEKIAISKRVFTGLKARASSANDDYAWLHVEGRYIKTSPYAEKPNQVFMGVGADWPHMYGGIREDFDWTMNWLKSNGANSIRMTFESLPYPIGRKGGDGGSTEGDIEKAINEKIFPHVELFREHQLYCFLDQHEYMHQVLPDSAWKYNYEMEGLWTDEQFGTWINQWVRLATVFRDEPWVMAYELCNEPGNVPPDMCRDKYMQCIKAIRQVDTRHIIMVGSSEWSHSRSAEPTWSSVKFKPDMPYNQVAFVIHEYPASDDIFTVSPYYKRAASEMQGTPGKEEVSKIIDRIQNTYDVPMYCTEFGKWSPNEAANEDYKRGFMTDLIEYCYSHSIGWSVWNMNGTYTGKAWNKDSDDYEDIWIPKAKLQGTPIPRPGTLAPKAVKLALTLQGDSIVFNQKGTVTARVCDEYGWTVYKADSKISFELVSEKPGMADIEGEKTVAAKNGRAVISVKAGTIKGKVTLKATAEGLAPCELELKITKK